MNEAARLFLDFLEAAGPTYAVNPPPGTRTAPASQLLGMNLEAIVRAGRIAREPLPSERLSPPAPPATLRPG